jgi:hypothetical protein
MGINLHIAISTVQGIMYNPIVFKLPSRIARFSYCHNTRNLKSGSIAHIIIYSESQNQFTCSYCHNTRNVKINSHVHIVIILGISKFIHVFHVTSPMLLFSGHGQHGILMIRPAIPVTVLAPKQKSTFKYVGTLIRYI